MKHNVFSRYNKDILYCFKSRITVTKFTGFIFIALMTLFIMFHFLFYPNPVKPGIVFINNNSSSIEFKTHRYSFVTNEKLVPDYVEKIIDKAQKPATCLIILRTVDGGIGNRMFFFASAYGLARLHQCNLYVGPWILNDLRTTFVVNINSTPVHLITNDSIVNTTGLIQRFSACTLFNDLLKVPLNQNLTVYEMTGFYQAYGYFVKYKEEITYLFQFNRDVIQRNVPLVEQLLKAVWNIPLNLSNYTTENVTYQYLKSLLTNPPAPLVPVTWIGIHIRRGDFLTFFNIDTSVEYLTLAMNYYRRKYMNCRFLIASDDKEWAKKNLGNNTDIFVTPDSFFSGHDLGALAFCEHTIVTAGSYGWWAAWLAGGNVIHDLNYPVPSQNCIREHYFRHGFFFRIIVQVKNRNDCFEMKKYFD